MAGKEAALRPPVYIQRSFVSLVMASEHTISGININHYEQLILMYFSVSHVYSAIHITVGLRLMND